MKFPALSMVILAIAALPSACSPTDQEPPAPFLFATGSGSGSPGSSGSGSGGVGWGDGGAGGQGGGDDGVSCAPIDRRCTRVITMEDGGEGAVEVRGNFAPDGWSEGIPMTKTDAGWTAELHVPWNVSVQYKFVIDGSTWKADPKNPFQADDGYGGWNSVLPGGTCDPHQCIPEPAVRFAVIGDYGVATWGGAYIASEGAVAALVQTFRPEFIVTLGDNNYPDGLATTIDENIGQFYHGYIHPYVGEYGPGAEENRFFPCLGNHDWNSGTIKPYEDYFQLPGNERYYDLKRGPVHIFCIDGEPQEPDGVTADSVQGTWLKDAMVGSQEPFKIVIMHKPPYSSGWHGSTLGLRWPYAEWGATAVMAGHDHNYERLHVDGVAYIVNGLGGAAPYGFSLPKLPETAHRWSGGHGATVAEVSNDGLTLTLMTISTAGEMVDYYAVKAP
ncbi:MAG: metallophosphoesterase [Polyangiaceae bacterium]|nr:metallophosphoesterase [Polyangiaceae bacterium]